VSHILYVMSMQPIVEGDQYPLHKKIGITNNTTVRASQLATKMPFRMYVESAWEIPDGRARELETALHKLLGASNIEGEWFEDPEETVVDGLSALMQLFGMRPVAETRLDRDDDSRKGLEDRYKRTEESVRALFGDFDPATLGWTSQPARAVDQRFIRDGATIYVQPTSNGASLVALGRDNPLGNQLRARFGERVNRSAYGNGLISDRVQVSEQELREFFAAPAAATVSAGPQVALVQSPA
jgi:hypothetical protein